MRRYRYLLAGLFCLGPLVLFLRSPKVQYIDAKETNVMKTTAKVESKQGKPFAYYTLTESCLGDFFQFKNNLGNKSTCDVYINSYKSECMSENIPEHFTYIHDNTTTWATGRNMLLEFARHTGLKYKYHIFFDDDAYIFHTSSWNTFCINTGIEFGSMECHNAFLSSAGGMMSLLTNKNQNVSPYREWENDLLAQRPAMAVPNYARDIEPFQSYILYRRKYMEVCSTERDMKWIAPTIYFDTMLVAYHNDALPLMLPYCTRFDNRNWWTSALLHLFRAKALLYRQVVANYRFTIINTRHRPYPQERVPRDILMEYLKKEATGLEDVVDVRDHSFANFDSWPEWETKLFGDPAVCTSHLKFPVAEHYSVHRSRT